MYGKIPINDYGERDQDRPYNQVFTYNRRTGTLRDFAMYYKINLSTLRSRVSNGWSIADAIERGLEDALKNA